MSYHDLGERPQDDAISVNVDDERLTVELTDGRIISTPLWWYPFLKQATAEQRNHVELGSYLIHWPDMDEQLSIRGILLGNKVRGATENR